MLNLDEAINRFEKLASDCEFNLNMHKNHVMNLSVNDIERIQEHLEENRQLAEWLRELKAYRDDYDYKTLKIKLENAEDIIRGLQEDLRDAREELRVYGR
jgi:chromosome segregation ATPase